MFCAPLHEVNIERDGFGRGQFATSGFEYLVNRAPMLEQ